MGSPIVPSDSGSPVAFTPVLNNVVMLVAWACCSGTSSRKVSAVTTARPLLVTLNLKILNEELVFIGIAVVRGVIENSQPSLRPLSVSSLILDTNRPSQTFIMSSDGSTYLGPELKSSWGCIHRPSNTQYM